MDSVIRALQAVCLRSRAKNIHGKISGLAHLVVVCVILCSAAHSQKEESLRVQRMMSADQFQKCGLHKLSSTELHELNGWLTSFTAEMVQTLTSPAATKEQSWTITEFGWENYHVLEGAWIIADDGQPLGKITKNEFDSDGLVNEFGRYGNEFNSKSIFNEFGRYGNEFSRLSPFNEFTSCPPRIYSNDEFVAYFTANTSLLPRINPRLLLAWLKN